MEYSNILLLTLFLNNLMKIGNSYGQVVRQWIANPLSPVRILVPLFNFKVIPFILS